jgi:para-nitrobenzyl esterase
LILIVVIFSTLRVSAAADDSLAVPTRDGRLQGVARRGGGAEFLGIPYAQPPIGALRWHEPLPPKPWDNTRDATAFGAPCAQPALGDWNRHDAETGKEDCLFLNVIVPAWPVTKQLPVMFWIHGGANEGGTASSGLYKDGTLVNHGVLLVTVNYRLGIFGFLAHPELTAESAHGASGNYGLMDQILALRWVRENIAKFGGDPSNITVFGQSAGAMDTGMLMTSSAKGLFQKAIAQSGASFTAPVPTLVDAEQTGKKLAADLKAADPKAPAGTGAIQYLRQLSAPQLLTALANFDHAKRPHLGPDIDSWVLRRSPAEIFAYGQESAIPLLFGTTTREFGSSASPEELRVTIAHAAGNFADKALAGYGLAGDGNGVTDAMYGTAADQWVADMAFRCPSVTQATWHNAAHHPTYEYEFTHAIPGQESNGAVHSADLPYVFGYFPKSGNIAGKFSEVDTKLSELIETYWTNFAKTGDPNSDSLPYWHQFGDEHSYIRFMQDGSVAVAKDLRSAQCNVYREFLTAHLKPAN